MKDTLAGVSPSPGGVLGSLVGGFLSIFGLQEGGLVRGSAAGTAVVLGENFADELVVPLRKLGLSALDISAGTAPTPLAPPIVNVYPQFVVENRSPLEADLTIYRLAESGRLRAAARRLSAAPDFAAE